MLFNFQTFDETFCLNIENKTFIDELAELKPFFGIENSDELSELTNNTMTN